MAVLDIYCIYWTVWDRYMQVLYLGRASRTKETLPDFLKWRRVTQRPLVFRGLTSSQRTPGFGASQASRVKLWESQTLSSSGAHTWHDAIRGKSQSGWIRIRV